VQFPDLLYHYQEMTVLEHNIFVRKAHLLVYLLAIIGSTKKGSRGKRQVLNGNQLCFAGAADW
jgi:hypothetical protein